MMKPYFHRVALVVSIVALNTIGLEVGLRVDGRIPSNRIEGFFVQDGQSYRLIANMVKRMHWPCCSFVAYTNSLGCRDRSNRDRYVADGKYEVFLGDSATFGNGVDYEESFVGIYEEHSRGSDIEVLNLAVGGHFLSDQLGLLRDLVESTAARPRVVFICVNPRLIEGFYRSGDQVVVKNGYLFSKHAWVLPYVKVLLSNVSAVYDFFRDGIRTVQQKYVDSVEAELKARVSLYSLHTPLAADPLHRRECSTFFDSLTTFCKELGAIPIYIYLPLATELDLGRLLAAGGLDPGEYDSMLYVDWMRAYCSARNLALIDLTGPLKKFGEAGNRLTLEMDAHYNRMTNRLVGEYICSEILGAKAGQVSSGVLPLRFVQVPR